MMALLTLAVTSAVATAGVGIEWKTWWGGFVNTAVDPLTSTTDYSIRENNSVIWQLIFAGTDDIVNDATLTTGGLNGDYVSGDDSVLATRTLVSGTSNATAPEDNTTWDAWLYNAGGNMTFTDGAWSNPGSDEFVYMRVFQGNPASESWYYTSGTLLLTYDWTVMNPQTQTFYAEKGYPGWTEGTDSGFKPLEQFPVPEPATMSLLGLGALVMAIRRRRS